MLICVIVFPGLFFVFGGVAGMVWGGPFFVRGGGCGFEVFFWPAFRCGSFVGFVRFLLFVFLSCRFVSLFADRLRRLGLRCGRC